MRVIVLILLCLFLTSCFQELELDDTSLPQSLRKAALDSMITKSDVQLRSGEYSLAEKTLDSSLNLSILLSDTLSQSSTLNNFGVLYWRLGEFDKSVSFYEKSLGLEKQLGDSARIGVALTNLGMTYKQQGEYEKAVQRYLGALGYYSVKKDAQRIASTQNGLGNVYKALKNYDLALKSYDRALGLWTEADYQPGIALVLGNRGNSYLDKGEIEMAIASYNEALKIKRSLGNKSSIAITLNNLGEAFLKSGRFQDAREMYLESLRLREEVGQKNRVATVCNNLALLELKQKNWKASQRWLNRSNNIIKQTGSKDLRLETTRLQKELYAEMGLFEEAYRIDVIYDELNQEVFNEQVVKVQKLQYEYYLELEESEKLSAQSERDLSNAEAKAERLKAQNRSYIILLVSLGAVLIAYFAFNLRKKNRHIENLIRELHHRMKNHLGMISGMLVAQSEDSSDAESAVWDEAKTRVEAVNGIHRRLYRQDEYEYVNMKDYLTELIDNNALVFGLLNKIEKELVIDAEPMDIDKAISVGLIANEVLTNAFKYGLQKTEQPLLKVVLEKLVKGYRMVIYNNASEASDTSDGKGFGSELIKRLAHNLKGSAKVTQQNGFQFELTFP